MNKEIMLAAGFKKEVELFEKGCCPICERKINPDTFRDEVSRKEFENSGLCQECQDITFGEDY